MNFEVYIERVKSSKNKTQEQVANDLGISTTTYNAWELNPGKIKLTWALRLSKYYGVTLGQILI